MTELLNGGVDPRNTAYVTDRPSGFVSSSRNDAITPSQKQLILAKYREKGNLSLACEEAGVMPRTLRIHRAEDQALEAAFKEIELGFVERAKSLMLEHMARPGNYMDRVTIARRFEPGVWGDNPRLQVDVNVTHVTEAIKAAESIDAELAAPDDHNTLETVREVEAKEVRANDIEENG